MIFLLITVADVIPRSSTCLIALSLRKGRVTGASGRRAGTPLAGRYFATRKRYRKRVNKHVLVTIFNDALDMLTPLAALVSRI